jgi:hypothetical protein
MLLNDGALVDGLIVCQFSCGAASAIAAKITLARHGHEKTRIVNAFVKEEDTDNRRFLGDCEKWFDHEIIVVRNDKYGSSAREVWRQERYIKGPLGASCSTRLKREPISRWMQSIGWSYESGDRMVIGFVVDEKNQDRIERGRDAGWLLPCVDLNLRHADCQGMVMRAGLRLPDRYMIQGFENANCVACCKGGERYFRKERRLHPLDVAEVIQIQKEIGPNAYFFRNKLTGARYTPEEVPDEGPVTEADAPDCTFFCAMAEEEIA